MKAAKKEAIISKYLNVNGKYSGYKSEQRKKEIQEIQENNKKCIVQNFPVRNYMKNGEIFFEVGAVKL